MNTLKHYTGVTREDMEMMLMIHEYLFVEIDTAKQYAGFVEDPVRLGVMLWCSRTSGLYCLVF